MVRPLLAKDSMKKIILTIVCLTALSSQANTNFLPTLMMKYPQISGTEMGDCMTCHTINKWQRNDFGKDLQDWLRKNYVGEQSDPTQRTYSMEFIQRGLESIEEIDSDGDGVLNYEEFNNLTYPGDNTSF